MEKGRIPVFLWILRSELAVDSTFFLQVQPSPSNQELYFDRVCLCCLGVFPVYHHRFRLLPLVRHCSGGRLLLHEIVGRSQPTTDGTKPKLLKTQLHSRVGEALNN